MIDIENEIFTAVSNAVKAVYPNAKLSPELILSPSQFPCVCVEEIDNNVVSRTQDSGCNENHANLTHEVTVYSNKVGGKKAECKAIMGIVDSVYSDFGFIRTMQTPVPTKDATKYRITSRYKAVASKEKIIYRR